MTPDWMPCDNLPGWLIKHKDNIVSIWNGKNARHAIMLGGNPAASGVIILKAWVKNRQQNNDR